MAQPVPLVFFDLETTGLDRPVEIVQLSAVCHGREFDSYVMPTKPVEVGATAKTGLEVKDGHLLHHSKPVPTVPLAEALQDFIDFVATFGMNGPKPVLVGHNVSRYDVPILSRTLKSHSDLWDKMLSVIQGYIDTVPLAQSILPMEDKWSYTQPKLMRRYLPELIHEAHNAIEDVRALEALHDQCMSGNYQATNFIRSF